MQIFNNHENKTPLINTCPGNGGRFPVQATWLWFSWRDICVRFWLVDEEDWMSFTPGTCTTDELQEQKQCLICRIYSRCTNSIPDREILVIPLKLIVQSVLIKNYLKASQNYETYWHSKMSVQIDTEGNMILN